VEGAGRDETQNLVRYRYLFSPSMIPTRAATLTYEHSRRTRLKLFTVRHSWQGAARLAAFMGNTRQNCFTFSFTAKRPLFMPYRSILWI